MGAFTLASSPATGDYPQSLAVGDFNGDGNLDLVIVNQHSNNVSILLGDGTGNFTLASSPLAGYQPSSVAVGDFNGDGNLDLAVVIPFVYYDRGSASHGTVTILLGDGSGNFRLASSPKAGYEPVSVAVGDFNGDGKLDLAVANLCGSIPNCGETMPGNISILLGDGTGNFTRAPSHPTRIAPVSVAVGDFNGDGNLDLAVANARSDTISIFLGDRTGNFTLTSSPATGSGPDSLAVGDFNGDGNPDLVVVNVVGDTISILLGDGTGNFSLASSLETGSRDPDSVAVGDFNGDGRLDMAITSELSMQVSLLIQGPAVTLLPGPLGFGNEMVGTTSAPQTP
jgi:hypothetical protein